MKNITKENKHEYRWTKEAEEAFQQMKNLIMDLPSLASHWEKETLYAYLAVSAEAVSVILLNDRKGRQCTVQYASRTLNEAKRNYAPMKKLVLSLIHMTRRLSPVKEELYFRMPEVPLEKMTLKAGLIYRLSLESEGIKSSGEMRLVSNTRTSAKTAEDPQDVHYGLAAILTMGHGHLRTTTPSKGRCQVRNCGNRLLHQMDRGITTSKDHRQ
nr:protein NYNRIN-like [Tanacetum cinerariifolium]